MTQAFTYCLAVAARRSGVKVIFSAVMSNHHHTGVIDADGRLPEFLEYLHKFVAKCGNALRGRQEAFWSSTQTSCVELVGSDEILDRMLYALTNPVKDGRVERVRDWPGLDCLGAIERDVPLTAERPKHFFRPDTSLPERATLTFVRPPGFEHMSHADWVEHLQKAVQAAEAGFAAERKAAGLTVVGAAAVLRQHWSEAPRSPAPRRRPSRRVAAREPAAYREALERNRAWLEAYRAARQAFLRGLDAVFPPGTYWLRRFAGARCPGDEDAGPAAGAA
jgi:hypothetical protein